MSDDVNSIFKESLNSWAQMDMAPPDVVEMSHPLFCEKLGVDPKAFSFKSYAQPGESADWYQAPFEFPDVIDGTMYLYLPARWTSEMKQNNVAQVLEGSRVRQTLILASKEDWKKTLPDFFDIGETAAFAYYPVHLPYYDQWVACVDMQEKIWIYTFYGAGDWILISKGDAGGRNTLGLQITSAVHSSPWYSWIASAQ
jgi:hypothetical protein